DDEEEEPPLLLPTTVQGATEGGVRGPGRCCGLSCRASRPAPCASRSTASRAKKKRSVASGRRAAGGGRSVDLPTGETLEKASLRELMRRVKTREQAVFKGLSNDVRRRLLELLAEREHAVSELAASVRTSPSLASIHLGSLRRAGLVESR